MYYYFIFMFRFYWVFLLINDYKIFNKTIKINKSEKRINYELFMRFMSRIYKKRVQK